MILPKMGRVYINVNHKSPYFEVTNPQPPGRGSQMRSMKRLEVPNNAATGASAALLTSRDKASKLWDPAGEFQLCQVLFWGTYDPTRRPML